MIFDLWFDFSEAFRDRALLFALHTREAIPMPKLPEDRVLADFNIW